MFIAATRKTGYDIAVHKSKRKQEEDNMDFSEKLKQIRKSEGKSLFGYYDKFCWVHFTKYQGKS